MKKNFEKYQPVDLEWQTSLSQEEFFQKVKDNSVQTGSSSWNKSFLSYASPQKWPLK